MAAVEPPVSPEARAGELLAADFLAAVQLDTGMLADLCNAAYETTPVGELLWAIITLSGVILHDTDDRPLRMNAIITGLRAES